MNGSLPLIAGRRVLHVHGGPYWMKPPIAFGVCMAKEFSDEDSDVYVPVADFSTPNRGDALRALEAVISQLGRRHMIYVGCMGGWGRTGLMLALIAKAWGVKNPIAYVRTLYGARAVETKAQQEFVEQFEIPKRLRRKVLIRKIFLSFSLKNLLTSRR